MGALKTLARELAADDDMDDAVESCPDKKEKEGASVCVCERDREKNMDARKILLCFQ